MASDALVATSWWSRAVAFVRGSFHEISAKTTWPDLAQVRQASIAIIIFVLLIGMVISLLDLVLHSVLVKLLPSLFA
jgi:preprotein translocase SecE subunit